MYAVPIIYQVHRLRDGNSFASRRVDAIQKGMVVFTLLASFQVMLYSFVHVINVRETTPYFCFHLQHTHRQDPCARLNFFPLYFDFQMLQLSCIVVFLFPPIWLVLPHSIALFLLIRVGTE